MNRHSLPACLGCAALLVLLPAQQQDPAKVHNDLSGRMLIRGGIAEVNVNDDMVGAVLAGADLVALLRQQHGSLIEDCQLGNTWSGGGHGDGVREIGFAVQVVTTAEPTREQRASMRTALAGLVQQRLGELLFEAPRRELQHEAEGLQQRVQELAKGQAGRRPDRDLSAIADSLQQQRQSLSAQQAEVRLTLSTESKVRDHLRDQRSQHAAQRDGLERRRRDQLDRVAEIEAALADRKDRIAARQAELPRGATAPDKALAELLAEVRGLEAEHKAAARDAELAFQAIVELTKVAAFVLEQLPATELLLVRSEARRQSLDEESARLDRTEAELRKQQQEAARMAAEADLLQVELTVARDRLVELQGQMTRLRPVRIDLLGGN